jgi:hypothetical protein
MRKLILLIAILGHGGALADVYRWVDENGNVVFSDRPHPGAEKIEVAPVQTVPALPLAEPTTPVSPPAMAPNYITFAIIAPTDQQNIHNPPDGNVSVSVLLEPSLDIGRSHRLSLHVDGLPFNEPGSTTEFVLPNVSRGSHKVQAFVLDGDGAVIGKTPAITFHLHRQIAQQQRATP